MIIPWGYIVFDDYFTEKTEVSVGYLILDPTEKLTLHETLLLLIILNFSVTPSGYYEGIKVPKLNEFSS